MSNPIATITNNTAFDVDVYDVYNTSGSKDQPLLTYTKLGSVPKGQTMNLQTNHLASQLQAMRTGEIAGLNNNYYYQFPVAVMPIVPIGTHKVTSYTITETDREAMEKSFLFQKYVSANADSKMAKDFNAALATAKDQEVAVNTFFASIPAFKLCTMVSWTAVVTWQSQFTSAWQGPYFLYTVPAKGSTDAPALVATVAIVSDAKTNSAVLTMAKPSDQQITLQMNGSGLEEENPGTGPVSVTLTPVWMNVVQSKTGDDGKVVTNYLIGSGLAGTVNGVQVFGTGQSRTLPDSATKGMSQAEKDKAEDQKEREFDRVWSKITSVLGLLVGAGTIYIMYKQWKAGHTQSANDAVADAASKPGASDKSVDDALVTEETNYESLLADAPINHPEIATIEQNIDTQLSSDYSDMAASVKQSKLQDMVDDQVDDLSDVLEKEPPSDLIEDAAGKLADAQTDLENGNLDDATNKIETVTKDIAAEEQQGDWEKYEEDALTKTKQAAEEGLDQSDSIDNAQKERDTEMQDDPDQFDPDENTFEEPETDPVEGFGGGE